MVTVYPDTSAKPTTRRSGSQTSSPKQLHCATLNVRFDTHAANPVPIPSTGAIPPSSKQWGFNDPYAELPWAERRSRLVDTILATGDVDIIGFQEVLHNQLLDIQDLLGAGFDHVGVGRDDGKQAGEHSPIFYSTAKFAKVAWKTIWLSPTPKVPGSKGWDANLTRIATLLTLRDKQDGELVHVINTHYDDQGVQARAESSLIIRVQALKWVQEQEQDQAGGTAEDKPLAPVILMGDFNSPPQELGYRNITSPSPLPGFTFLDAFSHVKLRSTQSADQGVQRQGQSQTWGPIQTYSGFTHPGSRDASRIDFLMLAASGAHSSVAADTLARGGWEVTRFGVVDNWIESSVDGWRGRFSDHRIVRATFERK